LAFEVRYINALRTFCYPVKSLIPFRFWLGVKGHALEPFTTVKAGKAFGVKALTRCTHNPAGDWQLALFARGRWSAGGE
jgi:hypothetical protein